MKSLKISPDQARRFLLSHHSLWPPRSDQGKDAVLDYFQRAGCVQFDPLNIVGHNSDLVLQSRVAGYRPAMLQDLLYDDRRLLDGWDKVMSIYRTEDWPFFQRTRDAARRRMETRDAALHAVLPQVRQAVQQHGPLSSLELDLDQTVNWPWGPTRMARAALESLYFSGELVIHHRVHTRKVYDLASRHLDADLLSAPDPNLRQEDFYAWAVLRRIGGVGLLWNRAGDAWVGIAGLKSGERLAAIELLQTEGKLAEVQIAGWQQPCYLRGEDLSVLEEILQSDGVQPQAAILAPLDNLLWDRRFVEALFDFSYRWEVYKPAAQREYGYYVLPVLYGKRFVARFEPGQDKKKKMLIIKNWWWEPGVELDAEMQAALQEAFREFMAYLGAKHIQMEQPAAEAAGTAWLSSLPG